MRLESGGNGWPSLAEVKAAHFDRPISIFASKIGLSHRGRDNVERRFQNPANGTPLRVTPGRTPLLLGTWQDDPLIQNRNTVYALADARRREGRTTRWSVFVAVETLIEAEQTGWAAHTTDSGERIICFQPELIALAVETYVSQTDARELQVQQTLRSTGYFNSIETGAPSVDNKIRLRRTVSALVRDARFRGLVLRAYDWRCSMCNLGLSLVEGAHIYPASAPESNDDVHNGIALCANHHLAFDRYLLAVLPGSLEIVFHPDVLDRAFDDPAARRFIEQTNAFLKPTSVDNAPSAEMLHRRYDYYGDKYDWVNGIR